MVDKELGVDKESSVEKKSGVDKSAGLRGQIAGKTALATISVAGSGLTYRGYDINDLTQQVSFEECAWLLCYGELPNQAELDDYRRKLISLRELPQGLKKVLEIIPASAHPMDVMRSGCSLLGNLEEEQDFSMQQASFDRMLALFPAIIAYWYRFSHDKVRIDTRKDDQSTGAYFLHMLKDTKPSTLHEQAMNVSLILYAEHEFNASTFAARVCSSTLSDIHSCITAAIGTLRGSLHGGANEQAMAMIEQFTDPDHAERELLAMLARKEKIMGFGHAVYQKSDPRSAIIKHWAQRLADDVGDERLYPVSLRCEEVMWREKKLFSNADFYHAPAYHLMGIPTRLFTPIFACSRLSGWAAHVMEQRSDNRIIRPLAEYVGKQPRPIIPIAERSPSI